MAATKKDEKGLTLVELLIGFLLLGMIAISVLTLFTTLIKSTVIAKRKAVASSLATTQMEYLKSLPYNSLAIEDGPIYSTSYLDSSSTTTLNGVTYTTTTTVQYVDDAFDGCGSYPNQTLKQTYCRNYPAPSGAPATDTNPADYKIAHVKVSDQDSYILAQLDTQISARVAETASTTGALFVSVLDQNGNPLSGANVNVTNTTVTPAVDLSDSTDSNGIAIFYNLTPDTTNYDYKVTGSLSGYSTLFTIPPTGSLVPTYPSQQILTQASSFVTLTLKQMGTNSLIVETTGTNGSPISGMKIYVKGGYKKYTSTSNTAYYYDNYSPTDSRPTTDSNGQFTLTDLVPGNYIFCGETANTNCKVGNTTYYVAAVLPYGGDNPFNSLVVPTYDSANPPATTFDFNGSQFLQKVRLMMTTSSTFPRIYTLAPYDVSLSTSDLSDFSFQITGANLPCSSNASSCSTVVRVLQNGNTYTASCTGSNAGAGLTCSADINGVTSGHTQISITANGQTLTTPEGMLGGFNVAP